MTSKKKYLQLNKAFWWKQVYRWHWISSALCLIVMLFFAITGITLNHASQITATPVVTTKKAQLPENLLPELRLQSASGTDNVVASNSLAIWLNTNMGINIRQRQIEWSEDEIYISLPFPGGDAWLTLQLGSGKLHYERTDRGFIAMLNDLHKGRNTGAVWQWFLDIFSLACLVFCATGLLLLKLHGGKRAMTWPTVGLGGLIPLLLVIFFIH